jgi:hypothetical protein
VGQPNSLVPPDQENRAEEKGFDSLHGKPELGQVILAELFFYIKFLL